MQFQNYEQWSELAKKAQEPFQAIAELNVKTLQGLEYIKPDELTKAQKPEDLLEKQVKIMVINGHKAIDYIQKSFDIMEKAVFGLVQESKKVVAVAREK